MTDDAKEWVTVKVEKPVRDDAQDDPRTYTEIMRAGLANGQLGPDHAEPPLEVEHQSVELDDTLIDADEIADAVAGRDVTLEASERRRIAQEVAEVLR